MSQVKLLIICGQCDETQPEIVVQHSQLRAWANGSMIQNAMPGLSAAERELIISGTCDSCFNKMFGDES